MSSPSNLLSVHLVGSVPLRDTEAVLRTVAGKVGSNLRSIPDGETGERISWIKHFQDKLRNHPALETDPDFEPFALRQGDGQLVREIPWLRFKDDIDVAQLTFRAGYADAAIASFGVFKRLQSEGAINRDVRFQVSLPTPMAVAYQYLSPPAREAFVKAYEPSLMRELNTIVTDLPESELTIQWDVCQEVLVFEDYYPQRPADYKAQIFDELARLGDAVPRSAQMGFHLCYGSPKDAHLVHPKDAAILVEIAAGIMTGVKRPVDFFHMPVPKSRTDDAFFAPLSELKLPTSTALYLGLVNYDDADGDAKRLATARKVVRVDGISAECGWGRSNPELVGGLLDAHCALCDNS